MYRLKIALQEKAWYSAIYLFIFVKTKQRKSPVALKCRGTPLFLSFHMQRSINFELSTISCLHLKIYLQQYKWAYS